MVDPLKYKRILSVVIKILIIVEFLTAFGKGTQGNWSRLAIDLILAGVVYLAWDRLKYAVAERKQLSREKIEQSMEHIRVWDALVFSLLWTDEIYRDIPEDRNRLVVISYTLIAIGVIAASFHLVDGFMQVVVVGGLILGAVNLLAWVV